MSEAVTMFKSTDGTLFDSNEQAERHDQKVKYCAELLALLGGEKEDPGCRFANGEGFYQLTQEAIDRYEEQLISGVKEYEPEIYELCFENHEALPTKVKANSGFLGRVLSESNTPFNKPFFRRMCVDYKFRLWGQPYFANNPSEGKQVQLG